MTAAWGHTDNHAAGHDAKVQLRREVLAAVAPAHVFDAFCGLGEMRREAWVDAASWTGCDSRPWDPSQPVRYIADNLDVMRAVDLSRFNVFDLDAYGSPWAQMALLVERRRWAPGERGAVVLTSGTGLASQWGCTHATLGQFIGLERFERLRGQRFAAERAGLTEWVARAGVRLISRREARRPGQVGVLYTALVFEGA